MRRSKLLLIPIALASCADGSPGEFSRSRSVEGTFTWTPRSAIFTHVASGRRLPPIEGGTLLVLRDDRTAAVSDPDHDAVWLVDLTAAIGARGLPPMLIMRPPRPADGGARG
jgi:hypothetical protein